MGTESQSLGPLVFEKTDDIRLMEALKANYIRAFKNRVEIETAHQRIPEWLDINTQNKPGSWWSSEKLKGHLPKKLQADQLEITHFRDDSQTYSNTSNHTLTDDLIAIGMSYIEKTEANFFKRRGFSAFGDYHRPDYYLIVMICERVQILCKTKVTDALVVEYDCLKNFLNGLTGIIDRYFPATTLQESHPFHAYLQQTIEKIQLMKARAQLKLDRQTISDALSNMEEILTTYQGKLGLYLAYCVTNNELSNTLCVDQLKTGRSIEKNFHASLLYQHVSYRLNQQSTDSLATLSSDDRAFSVLLRDWFKREPKRKTAVLNAYRALLQLLSLTFELVTQLDALSEYAKCKGQYKLAHDKTLSFLLNTYLKLIAALTNDCQLHMKTINQANNEAIYGREKYVGPAKNGTFAKQLTESLKEYERQLKSQQEKAKNKIEKIKKENAEALQWQRNDLVNNAERLLTTLEENAIIGEAGLLLNAIKSRCDKGAKALERSLPIAVTNLARETEQKTVTISKPSPLPCLRGRTVGSIQEDKRLKEIISQSETLATSPVLTPLPRRTLPVDTTRVRSPLDEIYQKIRSHQPVEAALQIEQEFTAEIEKFHEEIRAIPLLIEKLRDIQRICLNVKERIDQLPLTKSSSLVNPIESLLKELKESMDAVYYGEHRFDNFEFLTIFCNAWNNRRSEHIQAIRRIIEPIYPPPENRHQALTPLRQGIIVVQKYVTDKSSSVFNEYTQFCSEVRENQLPSEKNLLDHYRGLLNEKLSLNPVSRFPSAESQTTEEVEQQKSTNLNGNNISLLSSTASSLQAYPAPSATNSQTNPAVTRVAAISTNPVKNKEATEAELLDSLKKICQQLTDSNTEKATLEEQAKNLYEKIKNIDYTNTLHYRGGEKITLPNGEQKKVPRTIKNMVTFYEDNIANSNNQRQHSAVPTETQLKQNIINWLRIPKEASKSFTVWRFFSCRFFQPRDDINQTRYTSMSQFVADEELANSHRSGIRG